MNWRRGLFRLWAALSLAWVAVFVVIAFVELPPIYLATYSDVGPLPAGVDPSTVSPVHREGLQVLEDPFIGKALSLASFALGPPAMLGLLMLAEDSAIRRALPRDYLLVYCNQARIGVSIHRLSV
jgi:hypothetical protein